MESTPRALIGVPGITDPRPEAQKSITKYESTTLRTPFDDSGGMSAFSMLPTEVQDRIRNHKKNYPDLFSLSEHDLRARIKQGGKDPGTTENLLRHKLWVEYDYCTSSNSSAIRIEEIVRGVCSHNYFITSFLQSPYMTAWLMLPPVNYKVKQEEALHYSLDQMRAVLDLSHIKPNGSIDTALLRIKMGIHQMLEKRVMGEQVQKHLVAHAMVPEAPASSQETSKAIQEATEEVLATKVAEMQERREKAQKKRAFEQAASSDIFLTTGKKVEL